MRLLLLCSLMLFAGVVVAQGELQPEWVMRKKSPLSLGNAEGWTVEVDDHDQIYWAVNQDMPGLFVLMDATVYKLDEDTNEVWFEHAVSELYSQQTYFMKSNDTSMFLGGRTCSTPGVGNCEALIYNINKSSGNTNYVKTWSQGYGYEEIDGIHFEDDGVILTGWTRGNNTGMDMLILKTDYSGNELWHNTWGSNLPNRDEHQDGHIAVDDSMIYVTGLNEGSPGLGFQGQSIIAKFDKSNGAFVDSTLFGRNDLWVNAENGLGLTMKGDFLYVTGVSTTSVNNWDIFIAKFDKNLNEVWHTNFGGLKGESARSIHVDSDDNVYVVGNTESYGADSMNVLFLKLLPDGTVDWFKTWGEDNIDETLDFYVYNTDFYITGRTKSFHPNNSFEAFLMKVNLDSVQNISEYTQNESIECFPNPFKDFIQLNIDSKVYDKIILSNALGEVVLQKSVQEPNMLIRTNHLTEGLYILKLVDKKGNYISTQKLVKNG